MISLLHLQPPRIAPVVGCTIYHDDGSLNSTGTRFSVRHCASRLFATGDLLRIRYHGRVLNRVPNLDLSGRPVVDLTPSLYTRLFPLGVKGQPRHGYRVQVTVVGRLSARQIAALRPHRRKRR